MALDRNIVPEPLLGLMYRGVLSPLSCFFARFLAREYDLDETSLPILSAAIVSERNQGGEPCIDLNQLAGKRLFDGDAESRLENFRAPDFSNWVDRLKNQPWIGRAGDFSPLILEEPRLYLGKYWHYENQVQQSIRQRLTRNNEIDELQLRQGLSRLFPEHQPNESPDWQKIACALAVWRRFAIISGGPGSGKTTTLVKLLALLLEQNPSARIKLAAPTGKAAIRMVESVYQRKASISIAPEIRCLIPEQASTLHRLLCYNGTGFSYNRSNPLPIDCLVVDEASMIDLTLMARVVSALPDAAQLILIGDRDQLASVEAGNVLTDLSGSGQEIRYSQPAAEKLAAWCSVPIRNLPVSRKAPQLMDSVALLRGSYRFDANSGIGQLASLVNRGDTVQVLNLVTRPECETIEWSSMADKKPATHVILMAINRYRSYLRSGSINQALDEFERFRILCATRTGPTGVIEINRAIRERLFPESDSEKGLFHGMAIMITVNDYDTGLYNGDTGLLWNDPSGRLKAWFRYSTNQIRDFPVQSLPKHEPAWAITVHKSQGSEFDTALVVLPMEESNPALCRELIYTAITRCKQKVILHASSGALLQGVARKLRRTSGLADKLS